MKNFMENNMVKKVDKPEKKNILEEILEDAEKSKNEQRAEIDRIKQTVTDKELFDIQKFGEVYNLRGDDGELLISPEIIEEYEVEYYLKNLAFKSLQEYADYRIKLDRQEGN